MLFFKKIPLTCDIKIHNCIITMKMVRVLFYRVVENGKETVTVTEDGKVVKHLVNGEEKQAIKG